MDINVHIDVTDRTKELIEHFVGAVVLAKSGLTAGQVVNKVEEEVKKGVAAGVFKPATVAKEDKPAKVTLEKPVELEEEDPNAKVKGDMLVALREVVNAVIKENADNRQKLKNWLTEHGLKKVPDCTFAQASVLMDFMDGLGGEDNA